MEPLAEADGGGWLAYRDPDAKYTIYGLGETPDEARRELVRCEAFVQDFWRKQGLPIQ